MAARRGLVSNIGLTPFASTHHSVNWSKIEILYFSIIGHEALGSDCYNHWMIWAQIAHADVTNIRIEELKEHQAA